MRRARPAMVAAVVAGVLAILVIYTFIDPSRHIMPRCLFKMATGFDCPGCGTQRALHAILNGDVAAAWHYNAALFFGVPLMVLLAVAAMCSDRWPRLYRWLNSTPFITVVLVAIVAWWVGRNVF